MILPNVAAIQSKEIKLSSCANALYVLNSRNDTAGFKWYRCSTVQWTLSASLYVTLSLTVESLLFSLMYVLAEGRFKELQWVTCSAPFVLLAYWEIQCFVLIFEVNRRWRCSAIRKAASLPTSAVQLQEESLCKYTHKNFTVMTLNTLNLAWKQRRQTSRILVGRGHLWAMISSVWQIIATIKKFGSKV